MLAIASPVGVEVSTAQSSATSAQLCFCAVPISAVKSIIERESRSSFATTSAEACPASRTRKASCTPGRFMSFALNPRGDALTRFGVSQVLIRAGLSAFRLADLEELLLSSSLVYLVLRCLLQLVPVDRRLGVRH